MKYDDATWHSDGDFPKDLPPEAAATHIGMFLAWALRHDLGSITHKRYRDEAVRETDTPGRLLSRRCDGKLTEEDLNARGNRFARYYYNIDHCMYYKDLDVMFGRELSSLYYIKDDWETFRRLEPKLTERLAEQSKHQQ